MTRAVLRWLDVRRGEGRKVASLFAGLATIVAAHTLVETARDALFLTRVGVRELGGTYVVNAVLALAGGAASVRLTTRLGPRRALLVSQAAAALLVGVYAVLPPTAPVLASLYGVTALVGTVLVPQLWALAAASFDPSQARRLFAVVALAGIVGAIAGSSIAAAALLAAPAEVLLAGGAALFLASAGATRAVAADEPRPRPGLPRPRAETRSPFAEEPILVRIAVASTIGAVAVLLVDYAFKTGLAASVPASSLGSTLAAVGVVTNVLGLVAQLGLGRLVVARAGVVGANGFAPGLVLTTSAVAFVTGGGLLPLAVARIAEGASRYSVHRTASELLHLAVPAGARERARPLVEGPLARGAQALAGGALLAVASARPVSPAVVALCAAVAAAAWGAATYGLWRPYVALLRRSLGAGTLDPRAVDEHLDLASEDILIEALGSPDPRQVVAAIATLERRRRSGLVPALVLLHEDEEVLESALALLASTPRRDWIRFAQQLAADRRWRVRRAALRALTLARSLDAAVATGDAADHPWAAGYLAVGATRTEQVLAAIDASSDPREAVLGAVTALGDGRTADDGEALLLELSGRHVHTRDEEIVQAIAAAGTRLEVHALLPWLVGRLAQREGRAAVQRALVAMGPAGEDAVATALVGSAERGLRVQLPRVLELSGTTRAAEVLFEVLASDPDGLVRYRCLRALERLVERGVVRIAAARVRPLAHRALAEHFRLIGLRAALAAGSSAAGEPATARRLLLRLLAEKSQQSLARAYLVVALAFPGHDLRRALAAAMGTDPIARATAAELVDALLVPRRGRRVHDELREWLRLAVDPLPEAERAARAGTSVDPGAAGRLLATDADPVVRELARAAIGANATSEAVGG